MQLRVFDFSDLESLVLGTDVVGGGYLLKLGFVRGGADLAGLVSKRRLLFFSILHIKCSPMG
jgi:hypothetical protein